MREARSVQSSANATSMLLLSGQSSSALAPQYVVEHRVPCRRPLVLCSVALSPITASMSALTCRQLHTLFPDTMPEHIGAVRAQHTVVLRLPNHPKSQC